ncbi:thiamine pyrophosphate-binding protein [Enteractinococcus coprophilus]|uniref:Thiamine pyrophosphate-dependent acetolactate synthase large subunit-like protein n=1 Tax=Enteractinococcus coprophilus TaxID=1027633 RepID=A0A543AMT1_9MICC|nr:thiamine pyrophosphate-binding protein [Enteractinococcus coprophilus]TQL73894.1 thiamine pyrophosphate-dependent acetolactate synthase large subunit-like protein [Enteractinococcus coprophilus]
MVQSPVQQTTVTDVLVKVVTERVDRVFGLIGNGNVDLVSALTASGFPFTSVRHEVAAVTAADAYFRATGTMAVATATYGAGFTNMVTGLAEAQLARIPMVVVVGDAPSTGRRPFDIDQTTVTVGLNIPVITLDQDNAGSAIVRAFDMAADGQEPVVVMLPYDLADAPVEDVHTSGAYQPIARPKASDAQLEEIARALVAAERPLILTGGGVVRTNTAHLARQLGDAVGAVFMHSLTASNVTGSEHSLGIAGGFTPEHKLPAVQAADMVLILGATSNNFQTRKGTLFGTDNIYRIDLTAKWNLTLPQANTVSAELTDALPRLLDAVNRLAPTPSAYRNQLAELVAADTLPSEPFYGQDGRLNPRHVAAQLNTVLPANRQIVLDGGHFITWIGERLDIPDPASMIAVGTAIQSIGLGFGSAVGATVGTPGKFTTVISGDGGGQMALADLPTFIQETDHGAVIVFNDAAYGAEIHQYAAIGADATAMYLPQLDFAAIGQAIGATGITVNTLDDLEIFARWIQRGEGVAVVNINISTGFAHPAMRPGATG